MHQGGIILLAPLPCVPPSEPSLIETRYTTDKKRTKQRRELQKIALIQIGNGYSGEDDKDVRSSLDVRICIYRNFE